MTATQATAFASSLVKLAIEAPEALKRIDAWLHANGAKPVTDLEGLPDLTKVHLELAALELRAKAAGG